MTNSMTNYKTTFEATQNLVKTIELGHGENADLVASFTDDGVPVSLSGYTARAIYQPKSDWGTSNWYECPCDISGNTAIAHWSNTCDNGENAVKMFIHLSKDGKVAYPALYRIGLFATPGFTPSAIEPIPEVIDFSQYTLLNAPWVLEADEAFSVRSIDATEASSSLFPFVAKTNEILGVEVESDYANDGIYFQLPDGDISKAVNFYINVQNKTDHTVKLWLAVHPWVEGHGMAAWETVPDENCGLEIYDVEAGANATFHIFEMGTRGYAYRYQLRVSRNIISSIDFSKVTAVNAPWVTLSAYSTDMQGVRSDLSSLQTDAVRSIEYTGANKLIVKHFLYENPNAVVIWEAGGLGDMTQAIFRKTGDDGDYWTYSFSDFQHDTMAYFKITTDFTEITDDFILHTVDFATSEDATLSTVYSSNPRFSEWVSTSPYEFTVFWNETTWMFNFNGTNVNSDSEEWTDPNATHLYVNYNGIELEANRERMDVGYVLGSQTGKPLQPFGAYESIFNRVSAVTSASTDLQYPTAKCIYDLMGNLENIIDRM